MAESNTRATAIVTVTVSVVLDQPWGGECTLGQIQKQARQEAEDRLRYIAKDLAAQRITVGDVRGIRIVLNEEKL